jgi:hypothetical protein
MQPWFGLHLPDYTFPAPDQPFDRSRNRPAPPRRPASAWSSGSPDQIGGIGPVEDPMLEGWSTLSGLARETKRVRLGTLVTVSRIATRRCWQDGDHARRHLRRARHFA